MSLFHDDGQVALHHGDVRAVLREMPADSVQCVVTSPPYWSLRDYGVEPGVWGGEPDCQHRFEAESGEWRSSPDSASGVRGSPREGASKGESCRCCGAWRGALGLEPTTEMFVAHIVEVFREVRRVLRPDGTLWLNIGDSYAGSWGAQGRQGTNGEMASRSVISARQIDAHPQRVSGTGSTANMPGIKPKDLVGIPWMVAFALRADGWWLRQDIIWHKPNPMPESVRDRCTKAHEYLFLLSKGERYYYDGDAIREAAAHPEGPGNKTHKHVAKFEGGDVFARTKSGLLGIGTKTTRNKRSVWSIPTEPFSEAHFATFPPDLVKPCVLAGSREGDTVLDPFGGSGTTGMVARDLGRRAVLIDLNAEYLAMAKRRIGEQRVMRLEVGSNPAGTVAMEMALDSGEAS